MYFSTLQLQLPSTFLLITFIQKPENPPKEDCDETLAVTDLVCKVTGQMSLGADATGSSCAHAHQMRRSLMLTMLAALTCIS